MIGDAVGMVKLSLEYQIILFLYNFKTVELR